MCMVFFTPSDFNSENQVICGSSECKRYLNRQRQLKYYHSHKNKREWFRLLSLRKRRERQARLSRAKIPPPQQSPLVPSQPNRDHLNPQVQVIASPQTQPDIVTNLTHSNPQENIVTSTCNDTVHANDLAINLNLGMISLILGLTDSDDIQEIISRCVERGSMFSAELKSKLMTILHSVKSHDSVVKSTLSANTRSAKHHKFEANEKYFPNARPPGS